MTSMIPDYSERPATARAPSRAHNPVKLSDEVERLHRNTAERSGNRSFTLGVKWAPDATHVEYLYRQGQVLCRRQDLDTVLDAFDQIGQPRPERSDNSLGLMVLDVGDRDAADLVDALAGQLGAADLVTPNHVLDTQSGGYNAMCPATEAAPWYGPVDVLDEPRGTRIAHVAVVDTGFSPEIAHASGFERFSAVRDAEPDEQVYYPESTDIRPYGGHGTAAAACALAVTGADNVTVDMYNVLEGGAVDEIAMITALTAAVKSGADVISMQAGCYTRENVPPLAFTTFAEEVLAEHPEAIVVTAAGNNSTDEPFYPAAFDWVTGVGGLTHDGERRTDWSNHGDWVDIWAPGDNVTVPYPNGTYEYLTDTKAEFTQGHALWSGTSFATPVVAGMIARCMIDDDVDAPTARDRVMAEAHRTATDETGPRILQ